MPFGIMIRALVIVRERCRQLKNIKVLLQIIELFRIPTAGNEKCHVLMHSGDSIKRKFVPPRWRGWPLSSIHIKYTIVYQLKIPPSYMNADHWAICVGFEGIP